MPANSTLKPSGGDYTLMSTWEAAEQANFDGTVPYTLTCYKGDYGNGPDGGLNDSMDFNGWVDGTALVTIDVAAGEEHGGVQGAGFWMWNGSNDVIKVNSRNLQLKGLELVNTGSANSACYLSATLAANGALPIFERIIADNGVSAGSCWRQNNSGAIYGIFRNCLFIGGTTANWTAYVTCDDGNPVSYQNITAIGGNASTVNFGGAFGGDSPILTNIVAVGGSPDFEGVGSINAATENNASGDGTAVSEGLGTVTGVSLVDGVDFVSPSTGDWRAVSGGKMDGAGADLSADFTDDIAGNPRTPPWTIGAYDTASGAASITFDGPDVVSVAGTDGTPLPDPTPNPSMDSRFTVTE